MGTSKRQLKAMLRKNWLLKIRHPFITAAEVSLLRFLFVANLLFKFFSFIFYSLIDYLFVCCRVADFTSYDRNFVVDWYKDSC